MTLQEIKSKARTQTSDSFIVEGYPVSYNAKEQLAEFHHYGVLIRCKQDEFTYGWVLKMNEKLNVLHKHV